MGQDMPRPATDAFLKRLLDVSSSGVALVLLSPVLGMIWVLVRFRMGAPAVFRQERAGLHGRPFAVYKFRTMSDDRDEAGCLRSDAERLTPLGQLLRRTSLDELPQLLNVFLGQMSLVGPRPLYVKYIPRYSAWQARRLEVKPGITGLAQISGRNALSWEDRLNLDVQYVDEARFLLDLKILVLTLKKVVRSEGISKAGHATMEEFMGNEIIESPPSGSLPSGNSGHSRSRPDPE
jgi:sugar transferase EpsL